MLVLRLKSHQWSLIFLTCSEPRKDTGNQSGGVNDGDEVRPPIPVIRETLYDDAMLYGYVFFLGNILLLSWKEMHC